MRDLLTPVAIIAVLGLGCGSGGGESSAPGSINLLHGLVHADGSLVAVGGRSTGTDPLIRVRGAGGTWTSESVSASAYFNGMVLSSLAELATGTLVAGGCCLEDGGGGTVMVLEREPGTGSSWKQANANVAGLTGEDLSHFQIQGLAIWDLTSDGCTGIAAGGTSGQGVVLTRPCGSPLWETSHVSVNPTLNFQSILRLQDSQIITGGQGLFAVRHLDGTWHENRVLTTDPDCVTTGPVESLLEVSPTRVLAGIAGCPPNLVEGVFNGTSWSFSENTTFTNLTQDHLEVTALTLSSQNTIVAAGTNQNNPGSTPGTDGAFILEANGSIWSKAFNVGQLFGGVFNNDPSNAWVGDLISLSNGLVYAVGGYANAGGQARLMLLRRELGGNWIQLGANLTGAAYKILDLSAGNILILSSGNRAIQVDSEGNLSVEAIP